MNISNKQLAKRTGLHPTYVSRLRSGQRLPSVDTIWRLHKLMDLDIYQLVEAAAMGRASFGKYMQLKTRQEGEDMIIGLGTSAPPRMVNENTILATPEEWLEVVKLAREEPDYEAVKLDLSGIINAA